MLEFLLVCLFAGALTTVVGMGGGVVIVLTMSALWDPLSALTVSGPALLVGNLHRLSLYRRHVDWPIAGRYALGAVPAAVVGGLVATSLPPAILQGAMIGLAGFAVARVALGWTWKPPAGALVPGGAVVGFVSATSGGAGLLAGPMLLATGLTGRRYVATAAVGAASTHLARLTGYGAGGLVDGRVVVLELAGAVCIAAGNLAGDRLRGVVPSAAVPRLEVGAVVGCLALSLAGLA